MALLLRFASHARDVLYRYRLVPTREFEYVSPAATALTGYTPEEHYADPDLGFKIVHPEDRPSLERYLAAARFEEPFTARWIRKDGRVIWIEQHNWPILDRRGQLVAIEGIARDVTARREAEAARRASERTFEAAFRAIPDAAIITRLEDGRIVAANDAVEEVAGYRLQEILGRTVLELGWWPSEEARRAFVAALRAGGRVRRLLSRIPDATGRLRDALLSAEVIEIAGEPHVVTVAQDITEMRQAEEALRLSDSILQRVGDLVIVAGPDGGIRYVSPSVKQVLGYEPAEVLGEGWWQLTFADPAEREQERSRVARAARGEIESQGGFLERPVRARDGKVRWVLWHHSKGPGELLIGVGVDVTERRALEEQFRQAQKMEAVGRLAGGIAHDFNNLLTVVTGYTDLLLAEAPANDPRRADLREIRQAADRAAALTRQLLAYSRQQVLAPQTIELNQVIGSMRDMLQRLIGEDIRLSVDLGARGRVRCDPHQLEQVILNLAVNARDAMPDGGNLAIATRDIELDETDARAAGVAAGRYVELAVRDTGMGMSEEVLAHVFEPFFTTKPVGKGTGLGLATVYGIVKQSGGHIRVRSRPGEGATFTVYLPRARDSAAIEEGRPEPPPPQPGRGETVLLVEDDAAVRRLAREALVRHGYRVLEAASPAAALALGPEQIAGLDLLVTDVVLPGMPGRELHRRFLAIKPALPVLYTSGYPGDAEGRERGLAPEAPFLPKPFSPSSLVQKVSEVLASPKRAVR